MRLYPFDLVEPDTLAAALDALARLDGEARLVAGGTALVPMIRLGLVKPDRVISLHRLPELAEVRCDGGTLQLGAMARLADISTAPAVREGWPLLAEAARRVATPAIRVSGTIGGNLCYAEAASDPAPALLCLEAQVRVAGALDLILLKLYAAGPQDAWDVEQLLTGSDEPALVAQIDVAVSALPPDGRALWARIRAGRRPA